MNDETFRFGQRVARHGSNVHAVFAVFPIINQIFDQIGRGFFQRIFDRRFAVVVIDTWQGQVLNLIVRKDNFGGKLFDRQSFALLAQRRQLFSNFVIKQANLPEFGPAVGCAMREYYALV